MTAIRAAARAISPLLIRPTPKPIDTNAGDNAQVTKADVKSVQGDVATKGYRSASIRANQSPEVDGPASGQISATPPEPPKDIAIQKALETAYADFEEAGGGSIAELGRALYESVWQHLQSIGATNTPVKAAVAVSEFLEQLDNKSAGSGPVAGPNASTGVLTEIDTTPSVDDEFDGQARKIAARGIDIRI